MSVSLRLNRKGTKDRPYYKIVAVDSRKRRDGRYIEQIGTYDPLLDGTNYRIDLEKSRKMACRRRQPFRDSQQLYPQGPHRRHSRIIHHPPQGKPPNPALHKERGFFCVLLRDSAKNKRASGDIADEVLGLRQPAAAFRNAACCERGKRRFHQAFPVPMPSGSQQGCCGMSAAQSYSRL